MLSCPTLCDPMDCSPPGSSVHGILQVTRIKPRFDLQDQTQFPALQADFLPSKPPGKPKNTGVGSLSLHPSPADLPDSGMEAGSPALQVDSLPAETHTYTYIYV